jgi:signal transduction histidine kinase
MMFNSLRNRLILSHILPLLIIIPLMGFVLVYILETRYLLPSLEENLVNNANLLVGITSQQKQIWEDPQLAQALLEQSHASPDQLVMFIRPDGRILASNYPADAGQIDQVLNNPDLTNALKGELVVHTDFNHRLQGEVVDVFAPVNGPDQKVLGVVRMAYHYATVSDELMQLRYIIIGILILALTAGGVFGFFLALNIAKPIQQVTEAIDDLALQGCQDKLSVHGPDEIRQLERSVNFLVDRLHELEQARKQLLAGLVHELGRPLGALRMAIQVSIGGAKKEPKLLDELLEGMDEETARLERLLDDLAHLYDQVFGTLEINRQPVILAEWLPKMLLTWKEAAIEKRLQWVEIIPANLPTIEADPDRLDQIVGNLVSNAIKYTPAGGTVSISSGAEAQAVWIRVSDTGPGIPLEEQEKIFMPFYQGGQGRRIKQGMGLGLSIARDLAFAHGGKIMLESTPGLGSHFTVWIPRSKNK